jgi:hypothetical protein
MAGRWLRLTWTDSAIVSDRLQHPTAIAYRPRERHRYSRVCCKTHAPGDSKNRNGGKVNPIALAVLRLTISSNAVGCSTGRSAGFALLKLCPRGSQRADTSQASGSLA